MTRKVKDISDSEIENGIKFEEDFDVKDFAEKLQHAPLHGNRRRFL